MLIGFCGYIDAGKDEAGRALTTIEHGWKEYTFKAALLRALCVLNPIVAPDGTRFAEAMEKYGWDRAKKFYPEMRRLAITMGTDVGRNLLYSELWVMQLEKQMRAERPFASVITDVRFDNEGDFCHRHNGYVVLIENPRVPRSIKHESENLPSPEKIDYRIVNDGTIADLHRKVREVAHKCYPHLARFIPLDVEIAV